MPSNKTKKKKNYLAFGALVHNQICINHIIQCRAGMLPVVDYTDVNDLLCLLEIIPAQVCSLWSSVFN